MTSLVDTAVTRFVRTKWDCGSGWSADAGEALGELALAINDESELMPNFLRLIASTLVAPSAD